MDIEVATPPVDFSTPDPAPVEQDDSLAAHEASFGNQKEPHPSTPVEQERQPRHRAQSQRAKPDDVAEIAAQTKRLREAEEAIQIERKQGESDRVYQLRRRAEIAELAKTYKAQPPAPVAVEPPKPSPPVTRPVAPAAATNKPTWAQFEAQIGEKFSTWAEAQDAFADARDDWRQAEWVRQRAEQDSKAATQAAIERDWKEIEAHQGRMNAAMNDASYASATEAFRQRKIPSALLKAIVTAQNSPQVVLALAHDPDFTDELVIDSHEKSADDDEFVATLQRRLIKRTQAGNTGSAAVAPVKVTPRPPNPVRTGPIASGDELPGDESTLAEHEKAFGRRRRR